MLDLAARTQSVLLDSYLAHFASLFGDSRSRNTFQAIIGGILTAGSLVCTRIAAQAPLLSKVRHGSQRVRRFAIGDSTHRSSVTASRLVSKLAERGAASLGETPIGTELWLVMDGSDLRKPHAKEMPDLMRVRDEGTRPERRAGEWLSHPQCVSRHTTAPSFAVSPSLLKQGGGAHLRVTRGTDRTQTSRECISTAKRRAPYYLDYGQRL